MIIHTKKPDDSWILRSASSSKEKIKAKFNKLKIVYKEENINE